MIHDQALITQLYRRFAKQAYLAHLPVWLQNGTQETAFENAVKEYAEKRLYDNSLLDLINEYHEVMDDARGDAADIIYASMISLEGRPDTHFHCSDLGYGWVDDKGAPVPKRWYARAGS